MTSFFKAYSFLFSSTFYYIFHDFLKNFSKKTITFKNLLLNRNFKKGKIIFYFTAKFLKLKKMGYFISVRIFDYYDREKNFTAAMKIVDDIETRPDVALNEYFGNIFSMDLHFDNGSIKDRGLPLCIFLNFRSENYVVICKLTKILEEIMKNHQGEEESMSFDFLRGWDKKGLGINRYSIEIDKEEEEAMMREDNIVGEAQNLQEPGPHGAVRYILFHWINGKFKKFF